MAKSPGRGHCRARLAAGRALVTAGPKGAMVQVNRPRRAMVVVMPAASIASPPDELDLPSRGGRPLRALSQMSP